MPDQTETDEAAVIDPGQPAPSLPLSPGGPAAAGRSAVPASADALIAGPRAPRTRGKSLERIERPLGVSERVFRQIRTAIVDRELPPGAPVIIEQLAEALGVSRTPIREALPALQQLGLIVESGSGSFQVAPLNASYIWEVYAVRSALESLLVEAVAPLLTADDFRALRATTQVDAASAGDDHGVTGFDVAFHELLRARCPLPFLNTLLDTVQIHRARLLDLEHSDDAGYRRESNREHLAIVEALEQRDAAAARRLMQAHLDRVGGAIARLAATRPT